MQRERTNHNPPVSFQNIGKLKAQDGTTISAILRPTIYKQDPADVSMRMSRISSYQVFYNTLFSLRVTAFPHKSALRSPPRDKITHNAGKRVCDSK